MNWKHGRANTQNTYFSTSSPQEMDLGEAFRGDQGQEDDRGVWRNGGNQGDRSSTEVDGRKEGRTGSEDSDPKGLMMSMRTRIPVSSPEVYTRHQPMTPGWASPWRPEERGGNSIEIGKYRFGQDGTGYFPRTDTGRNSKSSKRRKGKTKLSRRVAWWKNFLIHNPFVPLLFRFINLAFTTATLAVAVKLHLILQAEDATDSVGSSPVVAIIFAPLTLVHVGFQIWIEYKGRPIGIWSVSSKLWYTITELIFICFWSAELSLAFDNYFTSTLVCVSFGNPFANGSRVISDPSPLKDPQKEPYICRLQGALIGLCFVSLLAYLVVLIVSLFRIFVRFTGARR
ncbi:hypothetical protein IE53DRAFT_384050 [Violaceomyces palustris]|uniref:Uncharacterized protein n=1 Tax=Violaceomyces palustris TaxID=1673888 RepID=A0ACD0P5V8_9BASI|nr:hypothetical protein IE53DRAFT_384050 [Violaceomyces palustris]